MSVDRILSQVLGSGAASGFAGGLAGGLASGLLTSKGGRKVGKQALKVGGIAAIGGLAYVAWSRYRQNEQVALFGTPAAAATLAPSIERFIPEAVRPEGSDELGLLLLQAMVAAAQADGRFDGGERHAICEHVGSLDLSEPEKADLLAQLTHPVDMNRLVAAATTPELAAEIYTASLLAIDLDTPAERAYLAMLAARLDLPEEVVESIHRELASADIGNTSPEPAQPAVW